MSLVSNVLANAEVRPERSRLETEQSMAECVHKVCSGIIGRLQDVIGFECAVFRGMQERRVMCRPLALLCVFKVGLRNVKNHLSTPHNYFLSSCMCHGWTGPRMRR